MRKPTEKYKLAKEEKMLQLSSVSQSLLYKSKSMVVVKIFLKTINLA